jgi:hypothetical protein
MYIGHHETNQMVRAVHEVPLYGKIYFTYDALLPEKLRYPAIPWYQKCQILKCSPYYVYFLASNARSSIRPLGRGPAGFPVCLGKGKAIPLQAWTGPECARKLRFPDFKTISTSRW